jgi:hypothetical protein
MLAAAPTSAQVAEPTTAVVVTLSWEALVAVAIVVVVVVVVATIMEVVWDWFWPPPPPKPKPKICYLRMHHPDGVDECVYECFENGTPIGSFTWELSKIARLLGRELDDCPEVLHGS